MSDHSSLKEKFGWCLYDWANSAFAAIILAAVLPVYFADIVVPEGGVPLTFFGSLHTLSATSLWGYAGGITSLVILISTPILGGMADRTHLKKMFLMVFCYLGSAFTFLLFFSGEGDVWLTLSLLCLGQYFFVGANVFYDAFLPLLADEKGMDQLSSRGYALGYLGGGLILAMSFLFIQFSDQLGVRKQDAVRLSLASAGIWWALFGTGSFLLFKEKKEPGAMNVTFFQAAAEGIQKSWSDARMLVQYRQVLLLLTAYMIYNDGVQTVIRMATIFGKEELHLGTGTLLGTLLIVQFVSIFGALLCSWISFRAGTRNTILGLLMVWIVLTVYAYYMNSAWEFRIMGMVIGLIMGGTQALSRSLYGRLIPIRKSAQFFGYFNVFAKLSAIWGPILFALIRQMTGASRLSVLSLSLFFLVGGSLLMFVKDTDKPQRNVTKFTA